MLSTRPLVSRIHSSGFSPSGGALSRTCTAHSVTGASPAMVEGRVSLR